MPINFLKTDDQPIKLRKKNFGDMKRGPLRAVMPIQSMTKEPLPISGEFSKQNSSINSRFSDFDSSWSDWINKLGMYSKVKRNQNFKVTLNCSFLEPGYYCKAE